MTLREEDIHLTVLGDCGKIHGSVEEWQQCFVCGIILADRLKPEARVSSYEELTAFLDGEDGKL